MADMTMSALTLIRGRRKQFRNLLRGLQAQKERPGELIVALMEDGSDLELPSTNFPVRVVPVAGEELPLSKARNEAARAADGEGLLFLDVDCVPSPKVVRSYREGLERVESGCLLGEVRYLPTCDKLWEEDPIPFEKLERLGERHPSKGDWPESGLLPEPDHGELWGLSFALRKQDFLAAGGFDEQFVGYGGEETDFAQGLKNAGVPLYRIGGAVCYHQHHEVSIPPLHQFPAIIRNAQVFKEKHGRWCMDYWLGQFREKGLIDWGKDRLEVLREPSVDEIQAARQPGEVRYS